MKNEGILVCAGDLNMILNDKLDTTNKRSRIHLWKLVRTSLILILTTNLGMFDFWRELQPLVREYIHYSTPVLHISMLFYEHTNKE